MDTCQEALYVKEIDGRDTFIPPLRYIIFDIDRIFLTKSLHNNH